MLKKIAFVLSLMFTLSIVYAECEEPALSKFPGYILRNQSLVKEGENLTAAEFKVEITEVFEDAVLFKIWRKGEEYTKGSTGVSEEYRSPYKDLIIELHNTPIVGGARVANVSIYTPWRANLTANFTIEAYEEGLTSLLGYPAVRAGKLFELEASITNVGEIEAINVSIIPRFKDFEILYSNLKNVSSICPNSSFEVKFLLRAPKVGRIFNYSLILETKYSDKNIQTGEKNTYLDFLETKIAVIGESNITIEKTLHYPWDYKNNKVRKPALVGDIVKVTIEIKNPSNYTTFYGEVRDILPEGLEVVYGSPYWSGILHEGESAYFSYWVTSKVPMSYKTYSVIVYKDVYGNIIAKEKTENVEIKFIEKCPKISIEKKVTQNKIPFENKVKLDVNETINVTITLENTGSATAYNVKAVETCELPIYGVSNWSGELKPGEKISYSFSLIGDKEGEYDLTTNVEYRDEFEKMYSEESSMKVYVNSPIIVITMEFDEEKYFKETLKVKVTVKNVGSKKAHNILVSSYYPHGFSLFENASQKLSELDVDESFDFSYNVSLPKINKTETFTFYTLATYQDDLGNVYTENTSSEIKVLAKEKNCRLSISGKTLYDIGDYGEVILKVKNNGDENIKFNLRTEIPEFTELVFGIKDCEGELKPEEEVSLKFIVQAIKSGEGYITTSVLYDGKNITKSLHIKIKGPRITIREEYSRYDGEISISFKLKNEGDGIACNVSLIQALPNKKEVFFISNLSPGETKETNFKFNYSESVEIPPYKVIWHDINGNTYQKTGESLYIPYEESKNETKEEEIPYKKEEETKVKKERNISLIVGGLLVYAIIMVIFLKKIFSR